MPGPGEDFGQPTTAQLPLFGGLSAADFRPRYVCALYIKFDGSKVISRHAYLPVTDSNDALVKAKLLLEAIGTNNYTGIQPLAIRDNFDRFSFGSQQVIAIFVDNPVADIGFDPSAVPENVIRFTPFGGANSREPRHQNYTFLNSRAVNFRNGVTPMGPWQRACDTGYVLEYWNTNENGQEIVIANPGNPSKHYLFSMNIHLRAKTDRLAVPTHVNPPQIPGPGAIYVPVILDPDTGNMGGTP